MENKEKLDIDITESLSELQAAMKDFELKTRFYRKILSGRGLEFDGYRAYNERDDASLIDWKASTRTNKLLVEEYVEERDRKVIFAIDCGKGMLFGSEKKIKAEYAAEVAASLAYLILTSGDKIGFLFFNEDLSYFPPEKGMNQFYSFIDLISQVSLYKKGADFKKVFDFSIDYLDKSVSAIIFISDFIHMNEEARASLELLAGKYELLALMIRDKMDNTLPDVSEEVVVQDPKTGQQLVFNPKVAREIYEENAKEQENFVRDLFDKNGVDLLSLKTNEGFVSYIVEFLRGRAS